MRRAEVVVVGGGPAGSTCARDLRRAGMDVLVVDRARFPRDKVCAGWITPAVVDALGLDLDHYAAGRTLQVIKAFRTAAVGGREVRTAFERPVSYAIRRCEFDDYLLERSGARLLLGTPVVQLHREGRAWIVNEAIEARLVVGAGGHFCPVAHRLNPGRDDGPVVAAQEVEVRLSAAQQAACRVDGEAPALYFCLDRRGYGWAVRKGEFLNVGFGRLADRGFAGQARAFGEFLLQRHLVPDDLPAAWNGHAYRLHAAPRRRVCDDGALLVGDAAGLAYPVSGEGILTAVESGRLAARAILGAAGDYTRAGLSSYEDLLDQRYGPPAPMRDRRGLLPSWAVSWAGAGLLRSRWFARHVLLQRWFLHQFQAPLEDAGTPMVVADPVRRRRASYG